MSAPDPVDTGEPQHTYTGRARAFTWCAGCGAFVGVWQTGFNRSSTPKVSRHHGADGRVCRASGQALSANVVLTRETRATVVR